MIRRIAAIVRADFLIRFRRLSTLVVFLLLSAIAYLWVPAPSTGRALMQIGGKRVLYNSAAIGIATALLASIFVGLAGFYVISNAVKRDLVSRCGAVIAATPMRTAEYLLGKFLGNVVFLATFIAGYMLASMAMLAVRAEAPLEPFLFAWQYVLLASGTVVFVSVLAIVFESVPWLSGRLGDVIYFFLWAGSMGGVVSRIEAGVRWARFVDFNGMGLMVTQMRERSQTNSLSIGSSRFDPSHGLAVIDGLRMDGAAVLPWLTSVFSPLLLLPVALLFFHRFDPARTRVGGAKSHRGWLARFNALAGPFSRPLVAAAMRSGAKPTIAGAVVADALLTLASMPLALFAAAGLAIAGLAASKGSLFSGVLPIAMAVAAVLVSDVASRDRRQGTAGLVFAAPRLREVFVPWKLASALLTSAFLLAVPVARAIALRPGSAPALLVGIGFVTAAATALGVISANPKTFIVAFLTLWYIMLNDHGATPAFDFAGTNGAATPAVVAGYGIAGLVLLIAAEMMHRRRESV